MTVRQELAALLEERTLSLWERRGRRLKCIPPDVVYSGISKARKREPLTLAEFVASHLGFLPDEYRASVLEYERRVAAERHEP